MGLIKSAKEAKERSLRLWRYLEAHPGIDEKEKLPKELWDEIKDLRGACPLCDWFWCKNEEFLCEGCPLHDCDGGIYYRWIIAKTDAERQEAASEIVRRIEAWDIEEEEARDA